MLSYTKGNEINVFRDGDWIFLNNPCLTDSENKEKAILAEMFKQKFKTTRIYKTAMIPIANVVWKDITQNKKSNPEKSIDITRALSSIMADIFLVSRVWMNQPSTYTLSDFNKSHLRITMNSIYSHAIATSETGILLKSKVLNNYDKTFFTEIKSNAVFDNAKNYIKAHTYMLNYINAAINEFVTAKNLECYLTSFINTCKKCKFDIPNYSLLRPVYTDGADVSNKLEIDTSKLVLRDKPSEKYAPKPSPVVEMPPTVPARPTETQAVVVATPSAEIVLEPKLKEIESEVPMLSEKAMHLLQEDADQTTQKEETKDNISHENVVAKVTELPDIQPQQKEVSETVDNKHNAQVVESIVVSEPKQDQQKKEETLNLDSFTAEEVDLISMIKEGWHAADIMKYFGIRSKNVLKVRLCDLAIRGVDISSVDWNPSNRFSAKVQKNGSIILSASKLHNCNFVLNPGDEVQITCKDGNLILTHNK